MTCAGWRCHPAFYIQTVHCRADNAYALRSVYTPSFSFDRIAYIVGTMNRVETSYGVDVAAKRLDDLDRRLLSAVGQRLSARVLDVGCGTGGAAAALEAAGAQVTGLDVCDYSTEFSHRAPQSIFIHTNIEVYTPTDYFDYLLCQRTLHYLPYQHAVAVLEKLRTFCTGTLFLSLSGLDTNIAGYYSGATADIAEGMSRLARFFDAG